MKSINFVLFLLLFQIAAPLFATTQCDAIVTISVKEAIHEFNPLRLQDCSVSRVIIKDDTSGTWPSAKTIAELKRLRPNLVATPKVKIENRRSTHVNFKELLDALDVQQMELYIPSSGQVGNAETAKWVSKIPTLTMGVSLLFVAATATDPATGLYHAKALLYFGVLQYSIGLARQSLVETASEMRNLAANLLYGASFVIPVVASLFSKLDQRTSTPFALGLAASAGAPMIWPMRSSNGMSFCFKRQRGEYTATSLEWLSPNYDKHVFMTSEISDHCKVAFSEARK